MPDGQPVHDRISEVCSVPSESTANPGIPRLSTATVRESKGSSPGGRLLVDDDLEVGEIFDDGSTAARGSDPAMTSTGSARTGRRSAPGTHSSAKRRAGRHPHSRAAGRVDLTLQFLGVDRVGCRPKLLR